MLVSHTWEKQLFELISEVFLVFAYPDDAILDDVGHKHDDFVRLSTFIVWEIQKCYMQNGDIF